MPVKGKRFAVIDLGTNSVRTDVYERKGKSLKRLYRGKKMIRLGDGVFGKGALTKASQLRALKALFEIRALLNELQVDDVLALGTSALRTARNANQFLNEVYRRTGIRVKVITGEQEARLIAEGIMAGIKVPKGAYALVDIGGGSTEVTICNGGSVKVGASFKLGANRLRQMFCKNIPVTMKRGELHPLLALRQHIREEMAPLSGLQTRYNPKLIIGSSGTIRAIAKIFRKMKKHNAKITRGDLSALVAEMSVMGRKELTQLPGLEPKRVDMIIPGAILLEEIMYLLGVKTLTVTDLALRDGILQRILNKKSSVA